MNEYELSGLRTFKFAIYIPEALLDPQNLRIIHLAIETMEQKDLCN